MSDVFISATIVTYNDGNIALNACKSVLNNTKKYPIELTVIDNASTDNTVDTLKKLTGYTLVENKKNMGFGKAHNLSLNNKMGKYHFVVNPDVEFNTDVISEMVDYMEEHTDVVMCMPRVLNVDGSEQMLPKEAPTARYLFLSRMNRSIRDEYTWANKKITEPTDIDFCSGSFFCIRSDAFKELGGFDDRYFMYLEDADLSIRAKKIGRVIMLPSCSITHIWCRASAKKPKFLFIHLISCFKYILKRRK